MIIQDGLRRMVTNQEDVFYYITLMNENYEHPAHAAGRGAGHPQGHVSAAGSRRAKAKQRVQLLGSRHASCAKCEAAAELLEKRLGRGRRRVERDQLHRAAPRRPRRRALEHAASRSEAAHAVRRPRCLEKRPAGPVVAASDYIKTFADQIRPFMPQRPRRIRVLGTDGFGRSDSRAKLRHFFEVNRYFVAIAALKALADQGEVQAEGGRRGDQEVRHRSREAGPDHGMRRAAMSQVVVPDIGDFKEVEVIEVLVKPGDAVREGAVAHHARVRQGDDGDSVARRRRGEGAQGQGRRQGLARARRS